MTIPDYQTMMLPVPKIASKGDTTVAGVVQGFTDVFKLTDAQLAEMLPSGKQAVVNNRAHWAKFYMTKAGLIKSVKRGVFGASETGLAVLKQNPSQIDNAFLKEYPAFVEFLELSKGGDGESGSTAIQSALQDVSPAASQLSPDERIESALQEIDAGLRDDLLDRLFAIEPMAARAKFFEVLVIEVLKKMGYGKLNSKEAEHLGGAGDGGVDGVVHLDALGIDRVYIQAKCYDPLKAIAADQVQGFSGALDVKKTTRGVFITTSKFTKAAETFVAGTQKQIVLIDGPELTRLMVKFGVGVRLDRTVDIKKLDEDFFELSLGSIMVSGSELIDVICQLIQMNPQPIPISLKNHSPQMALEIIQAVVEQCVRDGLELKYVRVDPELAALHSINEGQMVGAQSAATFEIDEGLGRQVIFERVGTVGDMTT
jgi:restriction system protein